MPRSKEMQVACLKDLHQDISTLILEVPAGKFRNNLTILACLIAEVLDNPDVELNFDDIN